MRILLAGESTAGQLSPLVVVYEALRQKTKELSLHDTVEFMLISTESEFLTTFVRDTEIKSVVLEEGYKTSLLTSIKSFFKILWSVFDYMPDVILVKGGYVSLPVAVAGRLLFVPVVLHESDAVPREMDKFIARLSKRIAVSFKSTESLYRPGKVFFSGNPINTAVAGADREESRKKFLIDGDKPVLFIMGGGTGARLMNDMIVEALPELLTRYEVIHQCGTEDYEAIKKRVQKMNVPFLDDYHLFPFLKQQTLSGAYAACDLVVSRAGANTVAEIMLVGKPSVLVPLSSSTDNENKNAFFYVETGAAQMINEKNLKPHLFLEVVDNIFKSKLKTMEMIRAAKQLAHPEAGDVVADEIIRLGR